MHFSLSLLGLFAALPATISAASHSYSPQFKTLTVPSIRHLQALGGTPDEISHLRSLPQHNHQLVYHVTPSGYAIADGDIVLGLESDLLREVHHLQKRYDAGLDAPPPAPLTILQKRALSIHPDRDEYKWPNATIIYRYHDERTESLLKERMDGAIAVWKAAAPWLNFQQFPHTEPERPGTITVTYTEGQPACWASVGWCASCSLVLILDAACSVGDTVHEFGHALGLQHEHQRPDRDEHMDFVCENLDDYHKYGTAESTCPGEPNKCCASDTCWGWACAFAKYETQHVGGKMDMHSVMHYVATAFARDSSMPTLQGKNGYTVPGVAFPTPSKGDVANLCDVYHVECAAWRAGGGEIDEGNKPAVCGNGKLEEGEQCDDGNTTNGDGCSSRCMIEGPPDHEKPPVTDGKCETCSRHPTENKCHITTSCVSIAGTSHGEHYCACRAGYKAAVTGEDAKGLVQWRLPNLGPEKGHRVFVKPGTICDTLCQDWALGGVGGVMCGEVETKTMDQC